MLSPIHQATYHTIRKEGRKEYPFRIMMMMMIFLNCNKRLLFGFI